MRIALSVSALALAMLPGACAQGLPESVHAPRLDRVAQKTLDRRTSATPAEPDSGKLTLAQAYQLALARSEQIKLAQAAVSESEIRRSEKLTEVKPNVLVTGTGVLQREREIGTNVINPGQGFSAAATVQQPLFRRGFFASREAAVHRRNSAKAALSRAGEQLALDVVDVFVAVLRARKLGQLGDTAVTRSKAQYDHAVGRVKAGNALKSVELLALVDFKRAERQRIAARQELGDADAAFQRVIGREPPAELEMPPVPSTLPGPDETLALARRRPDVAALEQRVREASSEQEAAAGKRWWPRVDLEGTIEYLIPTQFDSNINWRVLGVVSIPLLEKGREHVELSLRENTTRVATLELEQTVKVIAEEIARSAARLATTAEASELAAKQVEAATDLYKLVDKQFKLGAITFLEVTNAQAVLVEAENAHEIAKMERIAAVYDYLFAIGSLELK
jgi:outer membrane protein TolC